jgi:hypothetical protein
VRPRARFLGEAALRAGALLLAAGCAIPAPTVPAAGHSPFTGYASQLYGNDAMWLCRPDLPADPCRMDREVTEIHRDRSRSVTRQRPAARPAVDCFYVYPTVDGRLLPGNHTDTEDMAAAAEATLGQTTLFGEVCALYVPVYRQITIGTYILPGEAAARRSEVAFSDVDDAFLHYMGQYNHGRKIVLLGHSQGADMVVRLLQRRFEHDPVMRARLLVAMPIGGPVEVPRGRAVGGTFDALPLCTAPDELGCVVAFQSRVAGGKAGAPAFQPKPGNEIACVNPAPGAQGARRFSRTLLPLTEQTRPWLQNLDGVATPLVMLRDLYTGACIDGPDGYRYLGVATALEPRDERASPVDLADGRFNGLLGLHVLDFQFAQGDLVDLVARKARGAR